MAPMPDPVLTIRRALPAALCRHWLAAIEQHRAGNDGLTGSASLRLSGVPGLDAATPWQATAGSPAAAAVRQRLGHSAWCNLDQNWVRRQYPPSLRPAGHSPHSWHQDGALGHDFSRAPQADGGLLQMLTFWLALEPCGVDAPSLEWSLQQPSRLLAPDELAATAGPSQHARLQAGDGLLFDGALLHRTFVTPTMTRPRTSIEWRFFVAPPPRLAHERWQRWPAR